LDPPGLPFCGFPVFRLLSVAKRCYDPRLLSWTFPPPSGLHPRLHRPLEKLGKPSLCSRATSLGFRALQRIRQSRPFSAGMPVPARVRPGVSTPSANRLSATSKTGRICFAPATLVSFELQGFLFPPEIQDSFPSPAPSLLLESGRNRFLSFEGLLPLESGLPFVRHFQTDDGPMPS
jgi:hypothetical protein